MPDTYPKYFYDYAQGCLLQQDDADTLRYYYIEWGVLNRPKTPCKNAWEIIITTEQGYRIDILTSGMMPLEKFRFDKLLAPCQIKSPTLDDPLPSWFSWPSRYP